MFQIKFTKKKNPSYTLKQYSNILMFKCHDVMMLYYLNVMML